MSPHGLQEGATSFLSFLITAMDPSDRLIDIYTTSGLSIAFFGAYVYSRRGEAWVKEIWLKLLVIGWPVFEITALALSLVHDFGNTDLPQIFDSTHLILATTSLCGVSSVQVGHGRASVKTPYSNAVVRSSPSPTPFRPHVSSG